jgi:hypothetical protein
MYKWLTIPPDIQKMGRSIYPDINRKLNDLIEGHADNQKQAIDLQSGGGFDGSTPGDLPQIEAAIESNPHPSLNKEPISEGIEESKSS